MRIEIVEITSIIVASGLSAKPEWNQRIDYVAALLAAGAIQNYTGWWEYPASSSDEEYQGDEHACTQFGIKPIVEHVTGYFLVNADVAHDLAVHGQNVQEDFDNGLAVWCRAEPGPLEESSVLHELGFEPLNPLE
jgi:hypothetical protein